MYGRDGDDVLNGGDGNDMLDGGDGDDEFMGSAGADVLIGGSGTDTVTYDAIEAVTADLANPANTTGDAAGDTYSSIENLRGTRGGDRLYGDAGNNYIDGRGGDDLLQGGNGNDLLDGLDGNDTLNGGAGDDNLLGDAGNDIFVFDSATGRDSVSDFNVAEDSVRLDHRIFSELTTGPLSSAAFFIGAAAHDTDDRIIYNSDTATLIYDSNGNAAGGATQFATVTSGPALTNSHFTVV